MRVCTLPSLVLTKGNFAKGDLFGRVKALTVEAFPDDTMIRALKQVEVVPLDR